MSEGFESAIYAQNNFFATDASLTPDRFIRHFDGTSLFETGTMVDVGEPHAVDVVEAWNENNEPDLTRDVGWRPAFWNAIDATDRVSATVGPSRSFCRLWSWENCEQASRRASSASAMKLV